MYCLFRRICRVMFAFCLISLVGCNKRNCKAEFSELHQKRYSLWFHFKDNVEYDNFSLKQYEKRKKEINDSLQIAIDCAMVQDENNGILYLYKMKQLYWADDLGGVSKLFKGVDKGLVENDVYFQMSLYSLICEEFKNNKIPIDDYKKFYKNNFELIHSTYKERATSDFLEFLIDNDLGKFKEKLKKKFPFLVLNEDVLVRERVIEEMMLRGDGLVFD